MVEERKLLKQIACLDDEHKRIDDKISSIRKKTGFDQLLVQRLKKQKLKIKDEIWRLRAGLCEDIIA